MRLVWLAFLALVLAACGGDDAPTPSSSEPFAKSNPQLNRAPILDDLSIQPANPRSDQALSVSFKAQDPDHDSLQTEVAWYLNGASVQRGKEQILSASRTTRGDEVYAIIHVSDGKFTTSKKTPTMRVRNQVPRIDSVELLPKEATAKDELLALPRAIDSDNDPIEFSYSWMVNGTPLRNASRPHLESGRVRRGDTVVVSVVASDGSGKSNPVESPPARIENSAPRITSKPTYNLSGRNQYNYQVVAADPDGDRPLRYQLIESPPGMTIGLVSGLVSWIVPDDANGKYPVELSVRDSNGAESRQNYVLELRWQMAPANTP